MAAAAECAFERKVAPDAALNEPPQTLLLPRELPAARQSRKLSSLLEASFDQLRGYGLSGGAAAAIVRAVEAARGLLPRNAAVELTLLPMVGPKNVFKMSVTPDNFCATFGSESPLWLVESSSGAVLRRLSTLEEAVAASREPGKSLRYRLPVSDQLATLQGFVDSDAKALEVQTTRAIAGDPEAQRTFGPLKVVNGGFSFKIAAEWPDGDRLEMEIDGAVANSTMALLNSAKHFPLENHIGDLLRDADKLRRVLSALLDADGAGGVGGARGTVRTQPAEVDRELRGLAGVCPVLSGAHFAAKVAALAQKSGIRIVCPNGAGYSMAAI